MENEDPNTVSAETSASEPLSFDGALDILNQADTPVETPAATEAPEGDTPDVEADQAEPSQDEAEAAPEADPEALEFLHGNARTRLRDGSEVTIGELKKAYDEAKEYRVKQAEFDATRREFEAKQAQIAAQEAQSNTIIQQAKAVLQQNFPPKPDYAAVQRGELDIITYQEQVAAYNHAAEKWHALNRAEQARAEQTKKEQAEVKQQRIAQERQRLIDAVPEFKTEEGFAAFRSDVLTHGTKDYGFSAEELGSLDDHRVLRVMKDAIAYRKLQADKAKVAAKVKDVPPVAVQAPGRRASPAEKQAQVVKTGFERLRKTGSFEDALAILNQHDL